MKCVFPSARHGERMSENRGAEFSLLLVNIILTFFLHHNSEKQDRILFFKYHLLIRIAALRPLDRLLYIKDHLLIK